MQLKVVEVVTGVDVTDTSAIKAMAQTFANQKQAPFDVVINNAGYFYGER
jgi:NAD(P)-dependent dehydrogenase (short-subunit alcohol dehydrogenase family)